MEMYGIEINTEELYDRETKEAFMSLKCKSAFDFDLYVKTFKNTMVTENDFQKDVKFFNRFEFGELLINFKAKSLMSLTTRFNVLKTYIEWASDEGQLEGRTPITSFFAKSDLVKYISKVNRFVTEDELFEEIIPAIENPQDSAVFVALFELIKGKNNIELTNLLVKDLDFEGDNIIIRDENNIEPIRVVHTRPEVMNILQSAIDQEEYIVTTNKTEINFNERRFKLPQNSFVFRQYMRDNSTDKRFRKSEYSGTNEPISWQTINNRVKRIAIEVNKPYLTALSIYQSGLLNRIYKIEEEKGVLTADDYRKVLEDAGADPKSYFQLKQLYVTEFNTETVDKIK